MKKTKVDAVKLGRARGRGASVGAPIGAYFPDATTPIRARSAIIRATIPQQKPTTITKARSLAWVLIFAVVIVTMFGFCVYDATFHSDIRYNVPKGTSNARAVSGAIDDAQQGSPSRDRDE